ncbi:hypothetical protein ACGF0J_21965 [Nonomuraea sp. NPDC047897]|uniref:hypothetical protein n=1 Tax=Nonomuraea sp. NPDC047897 TaxID=3364346 RepID=UPI00371AC1F4
MALSMPLERVTQEARRVDVRKGLIALLRVLGTLVLAIPYGIAWCLRTLLLGATMLWVAAVAGWTDASRTRREGGTEF